MLFVCSSNDIPRVTAHIYLPLAPIKSIYLYAPVSRSDHLLFIILIYSQSIIHFLQLSRRRTGVPSPGISTFSYSIYMYVYKAKHRAPYAAWAHWTADGRTAEKWRRTATKKSATWPMKRGIIYCIAQMNMRLLLSRSQLSINYFIELWSDWKIYFYFIPTLNSTDERVMKYHYTSLSLLISMENYL